MEPTQYTNAQSEEVNINKRQVGGAHYAPGIEYQHWDFAVDCNMRYLEGNATKYIFRHSKKGGKVDLDKALHYIDKIIHLHKANKYISAMSHVTIHNCDILQISANAHKLITAHCIPPTEALCISILSSWGDVGALDFVRQRVGGLVHCT